MIEEGESSSDILWSNIPFIGSSLYWHQVAKGSTGWLVLVAKGSGWQDRSVRPVVGAGEQNQAAPWVKTFVLHFFMLVLLVFFLLSIVIFTLFPQYYYRLNMCGGHEVCAAHVNVTGTSRQKAPLVKTVISGQITPAATRSEMLAVNSWWH